MATFANSYVPIGQNTDARYNYLVDTRLTPRLLAFRQVTVYDEAAVLMPDYLTWRVSYGNWNPTYPFVVHYNKVKIPFTSLYNVDYNLGSYQVLTAGPQGFQGPQGFGFQGPVQVGDNSNLTYNFDYFGNGVLVDFLNQAVDTINSAGAGAPTNYTVSTAPQYWDGPISDIAFALCMQKLILEYDLWYGRLIFALGAQALEDGGGDIIGALETLKTNAEESANKALDNPLFKNPPYLSRPTAIYYQSIQGTGRTSGHGERAYGPLRGMRINKYGGM